jgi:hypothetical protein
MSYNIETFSYILEKFVYKACYIARDVSCFVYKPFLKRNPTEHDKKPPRPTHLPTQFITTYSLRIVLDDRSNQIHNI